MHAVFLDQETLAPSLDFNALDSSVTRIDYYPYTTAADTLSRIQHADIIISNKVIINADMMAQCPNLKLICVVATGTNNVDIAAAKAHGITVCNARGYCTASVVQHTFAMMLALRTQLLPYHQAVQQGRWSNSRQFCLLDYPAYELNGQTLGIVGYGELGQAIAKVATAFGMQVRIANRPNTPLQSGRDDLAALLPEIDVLSLHCPLTPDTQNLIDANALSLMKPSAILINNARGGVVNEIALANALRQQSIAGAATDVLSQEPPPADHPLLAPDLPNLIITPHVAWAGVQAQQNLLAQVVANIQAFQAGNPINQVN